MCIYRAMFDEKQQCCSKMEVSQLLSCVNGTLCEPLAPMAREAPKMLGWNVPREELSYIPEHWFTFEEPDPVHHYILGMLYSVFMAAAFIGNGLVIWIFCSAKSLRTTSNIFVLNLALCDFLMFVKVPIFIYNCFHFGFAAGLDTACQIYGVIGTCSGIGAAATNVCIAYDRYRTIACPFDGKLSKCRAITLAALTWAWTLPWALLPYFNVWGRFVPEGYLTSCSFDYLTDSSDIRTFVGVMFVCAYVIPITMVIYFYTQIVGQVVQHEKSLREQAKKMNVASLRSNKEGQTTTAEIRIAKAAVTICFFFVAAWTPYAVVALIGAFGKKALLTPFATMVPALACKMVACVDPYIYAISHPRYRLELAKRIPWLAIRENPISETQSTTTEQIQNTASTPA